MTFDVTIDTRSGVVTLGQAQLPARVQEIDRACMCPARVDGEFRVWDTLGIFSAVSDDGLVRGLAARVWQTDRHRPVSHDPSSTFAGRLTIDGVKVTVPISVKTLQRRLVHLGWLRSIAGGYFSTHGRVVLTALWECPKGSRSQKVCCLSFRLSTEDQG